MKSFFKSFFASLLAIIIFFLLIFLLFVGIAGSIISEDKPTVETNSVLVIDLSKSFTERENEDIVAQLTGKDENIAPTLSIVLKLIESAKTDSLIKGIYILSKENANGYAASNELRQALLDFKLSGKFIISYGDYISQKAYYVANVSDKIYCNPKGLVEWQGMSVEYTYFKNLIDKLEIKPQIFYAGKFKSATEPFREAQMTEPNRIQTTIWLNDLYNEIINTTAKTRKLNTDSLKSFANRYAIVDPAIALEKGLIDGLKYDDQVKDLLRAKLNIDKTEKINFIGLSRYNKSNPIKASFEKDKIAVVVAEGEIVYGKGEMDQVGSEEYMSLLHKIRDDKSIKAVVLRINSPGGSSLASEMIWRELELIKKSGKPIIVSMGNVAASGGYYIACNANEIYADENTITGSIGVFSIIPDFSSFMKNKLGITFDRVKTSEFADAPSATRPMNDFEKKIIQQEVDKIYLDFKTRVANGRKKSVEYIDSIAQGRVWTGNRAIEIGLVDKIGGIESAIAKAAELAHLKKYRIRKYPEPESILDQLFNKYPSQLSESSLKKEIGIEAYDVLKQVKKMKSLDGRIQTRVPFEMKIN